MGLMAIRYMIQGFDPVTEGVVEEYTVPYDIFEEACKRLKTDPKRMIGEQLLSGDTAYTLLAMEGVILEEPGELDWYIGSYAQG